MAAKDTTPVKYYEIADRKKSGFVMDGTNGTPYQQELTTPTVRWIPTTGKTMKEKGKPQSGYKEIRYLNGCDFIDPEEQNKRGFEKRKLEDKIPMENGFMTVRREGAEIGLYDYLEKVFYNQDNPDRPASADAIYREVKLDKKAVQLVDEDEMLTNAKVKIYNLRLKKSDGSNVYNTDKISAMCRLMQIYAETPEQQLVALLHAANQDPKGFLRTVEISEQTVVTEIAHALEMKLIKFDENIVRYIDENKVIFSFGKAKINEDEKIDLFASWLQTAEGNGALTDLRTKLEVAKAALLK